MKIAQVKIVKSATHPQGLSLRGPQGRGHNDPFQPYIEKAGFSAETPAVVLSQAEFMNLVGTTRSAINLAKAAKGFPRRGKLGKVVGELETIVNAVENTFNPVEV